MWTWAAGVAGREAAGHADDGSDSGVAQEAKFACIGGWFRPAVFFKLWIFTCIAYFSGLERYALL